MNETRSKSYTDAANTLNANPHLSNDDAIVVFLEEIAGSLAVIADAITANKMIKTEEKYEQEAEWIKVLKNAKLDIFRVSLGEME